MLHGEGALGWTVLSGSDESPDDACFAYSSPGTRFLLPLISLVSLVWFPDSVFLNVSHIDQTMAHLRAKIGMRRDAYDPKRAPSLTPFT